MENEGPNFAPRVEASPENALGATAHAASEPALEPLEWPAEGLFVRAMHADGTVAAGAPIGVWVTGGRTVLAQARSDAEGRVRLRGVTALAARYEVGLVGPGAPRSSWPVSAANGSATKGSAMNGSATNAPTALGLRRDAPLELELPQCGTLEVQVVRASRRGTSVELGQGRAAGYQLARSSATEADGIARFDWLPLGLELTVRVAFGEGTVEAVVAGPDAPPEFGAGQVPPRVVVRCVKVGPEGLVEG